ncbi:MAG: ATP-binding protein [bacterium]|nr:ATP-binding protein [bacterium]MDP3963771.1 ATP-binding protein [bacterium]
MPFKMRLKVITVTVAVIAVLLGVFCRAIISKSQQATGKASIASRIILEIFEKRILLDEYLQAGSDRAKSQWFSRQVALAGLMRDNEALFKTDAEKELVLKIKKSITESEAVFLDLVALSERDFVEENEALLEEKARRLSSQSLVKSQEIIAAASRLKNINDAYEADAFGKIVLSFSIAGGLFLVLLIVCFREIWRGVDEMAKKKSEDEGILSGIGDAVFAVDAQGKITLFNDATSQITGFGAKEALGRRYDEVLKFVNEKTKEPETEFIQAALVGTKTHMPEGVEVIAKSGNPIPVADSASPIVDANGLVVGAVIVFRDITVERELSRAKEEFVYFASHQLRTPLAAIKGYTEMLIAGDAGAINDKQREYLLEIDGSDARILNLINSLLNVSRIDMGVFTIEPESLVLSEIAKTALGELALKTKEKNITMHAEFDADLPRINADPKLVGIIFQNLLSNAVKYTSKGGSVSLTIEKRNADAHIAVADTGIGIPKSQQKKIFSRLFRADNARIADHSGTGLGLYIVKAIVEAAGGKIWFESEEQKGTVFHVLLPLSGMKKRDGAKGLT